MSKTAIIDGKRIGKGANKYTAYTYVTDTEKRCSSCQEIKPLDSFHKDKKNIHGKGRSYYCKDCANTKARTHTKKYAETPEYKQAKRNAYYLNRHGITLEEFESKLQDQHYKCAICEIDLKAFGYNTHMDHDHSTGKLRDILCTNCNRGLGHFQDNPQFLEKAIKYLDSHTANGKQKGGRCL